MRIGCAVAHALAAVFCGRPVRDRQDGRFVDTRIIACQMGLFGYSPERRIVKAAESVSDELAGLLRQSAVTEHRCAARWRIADDLKLQRMAVAAACERLGLEVKPCQSGALQRLCRRSRYLNLSRFREFLKSTRGRRSNTKICCRLNDRWFSKRSAPSARRRLMSGCQQTEGETARLRSVQLCCGSVICWPYGRCPARMRSRLHHRPRHRRGGPVPDGRPQPRPAIRWVRRE